MKVILKKEVKGIGEAGSVADVKNGFARNYLFPKNLALEYSQGNLKVFEVEKKRMQGLAKKKEQDAQELAQKLKEFSCTLKVNAGPDDKLFGSVTNQDIAKILQGEGISVDKKDIILDEPIKNLGIYKISLKLHPEVTAEVRLWVVKE